MYQLNSLWFCVQQKHLNSGHFSVPDTCNRQPSLHQIIQTGSELWTMGGALQQRPLNFGSCLCTFTLKPQLRYLPQGHQPAGNLYMYQSIHILYGMQSKGESHLKLVQQVHLVLILPTTDLSLYIVSFRLAAAAELKQYTAPVTSNRLKPLESKCSIGMVAFK